MNMKI
jgi:hypothetical protein